jgi:type IV pilus assembly protein PilW
MNRFKLQSGFTIVELMVSLVLGLLVILVIGSIFIANSSTFRATDDSARIQENGRFALQAISRVVKQAGYMPPDVATRATNLDSAFGRPTVASPWLGGNVNSLIVSGLDGVAAANGYSDELFVAFKGGVGGTKDCIGRELVTPPLAETEGKAALLTYPTLVNRFYVANGADGEPALFCERSVVGGGVVITPETFELASGVASFQVLYAIDKAVANPLTPTVPAKPDGLPDYYATASEVISSSASDVGKSFMNVTGLQVSLIMRGKTSSRSDSQDGRVIRAFGTSYPTGDPGANYAVNANDRFRIFRAVSSTIAVRVKSI